MFTFDENTVSDLRKDAYGSRPSQSWWYGWTHATDEQKQYQWDHLLECLEATITEEKEIEDRAIKAFEVLVDKTIANGAKGRGSALQWIMEASTCDDNWEYLCFTYGLPYNYFGEI